mmetsp:Transcript_105424/g.263892  ORF Transcript_105424/g.263892 Transcript_105424/m.263892 type:complete len:242 (+) Transcript_105424:917-1642(+)
MLCICLLPAPEQVSLVSLLAFEDLHSLLSILDPLLCLALSNLADLLFSALVCLPERRSHLLVVLGEGLEGPRSDLLILLLFLLSLFFAVRQVVIPFLEHFLHALGALLLFFRCLVGIKLRFELLDHHFLDVFLGKFLHAFHVLPLVLRDLLHEEGVALLPRQAAGIHAELARSAISSLFRLPLDLVDDVQPLLLLELEEVLPPLVHGWVQLLHLPRQDPEHAHGGSDPRTPEVQHWLCHRP